jgi:hypothetical protein
MVHSNANNLEGFGLQNYKIGSDRMVTTPVKDRERMGYIPCFVCHIKVCKSIERSVDIPLLSIDLSFNVSELPRYKLCLIVLVLKSMAKTPRLSTS